MAILDAAPRSATVTAVDETINLLKITREDFQEIMSEKPEIADGHHQGAHPPPARRDSVRKPEVTPRPCLTAKRACRQSLHSRAHGTTSPSLAGSGPADPMSRPCKLKKQVEAARAASRTTCSRASSMIGMYRHNESKYGEYLHEGPSRPRRPTSKSSACCS
jgi:hypothetical protein